MKDDRTETVVDMIPSAEKGEQEDHPSSYLIDETNISIYPMSANKCAKYAYKIARELNIGLRVEFHWRDKEGALHPNKKGLIKFEPRDK